MGRNIRYHFADVQFKLDYVESYHWKCQSSIECKYSIDRNRNYASDFQHMTQEEVVREAEQLKAELEKETMFSFLACIEALLRIDYIIRLEKKDKAPLSCFFRNSFKQSKELKKRSRKTLESKKRNTASTSVINEKYRVDLCDVIIKGWREFFPEEKTCLNLLNDAFKYRNWIAHGRYNHFEDERKYDFMMILSLVNVFKEQIAPKLKQL